MYTYILTNEIMIILRVLPKQVVVFHKEVRK